MPLKGLVFLRDLIIARYGGTLHGAIAKFCAEHPEFTPSQVWEVCKARRRPSGDLILALCRALNVPHLPAEWIGWKDPYKPSARNGR